MRLNILAAAVAVALAGSSASAQESIVQGASSSGHTTFQIMTGWSSVINREVPEVSMTVQASGPSVPTTQLVQQGRIQAGPAGNSAPYEAVRSIANFEGQPKADKVRTWMPIYVYGAQLVVPAESDVQDWTDLEGLRVGIALARLEAEGFLTWEANRGYRVTVFAIEDVRAIYGVRAILEAEAVRLSGRRGLSAVLVRELTELTRQMEEIVYIPDHSAEQRAWFLKMNHRFHRQIYDNCANEFLLRQIASTADLPLALRNFFSFSAEQLTESHAAHVNILAALTSGEADRAAGLMREHIWAARDRMSVKKTKRAGSQARRVPMSRGKRILVPAKERAGIRKESEG